MALGCTVLSRPISPVELGWHAGAHPSSYEAPKSHADECCDIARPMRGSEPTVLIHREAILHAAGLAGDVLDTAQASDGASIRRRLVWATRHPLALVEPQRDRDVVRDSAEPTSQIERLPCLQGHGGLLDQAGKRALEPMSSSADEDPTSRLSDHLAAKGGQGNTALVSLRHVKLFLPSSVLWLNLAPIAVEADYLGLQPKSVLHLL